MQAQTGANRLNPKDLNLTWEVVEEGYQNKNQTHSALTLQNTGQNPLPATGWSLYFHGSPSFKTKDTNAPVKIEHVNGDLLRIVPTASFSGLSAGSTKRVELVSAGQMVNESRAPEGFYLVWNDNPAKGYTIGSVVNKKPTQNKIGWIASGEIYEQNKVIKDIPVEKLTKVFPTPSQYSENGQRFTLTSAVPVIADNAFTNEAALLTEYLSTVFGQKPAVKTSGTGKAIRLQQKQGMGEEAYELQVTPQQVVITASTPAGIFYGIQSLKTLMPPSALATKQSSVTLTGVNVKDAPRFGHRAFMMDVARNFQQKEEVLKVLDLMALYKLNVLHFHLNDDEGWRLEIPALPELTQIGSRRGHTSDDSQNLQPSLGSGPDVDASSGSGYYSKADYVEILRYANARHIKVIPEIETPGHARAAIKAMDARYERLMKEGKQAEAEKYLLRDLKDKSVYRSVQNWNDNVIDVALPSTYTFLEKVTDEILAMYKEVGAPIETIHFGGDEVPPGVWEKSPAVQKVMASNSNVKNTDDLWYYFFGKINDMLKERNLYLSGWEEIGMRKVKQNGKTTYIANPDFANENFHVDVWNNLGSNIDLAYRLANAGYKVVLTNVTNMYLDLAYQKAYEEPGLNWGGFLDVDKPFYFIPYDYMKNMKVDTENKPINRNAFAGKERLTEAGKKNIVGLQAPLWSETVRTPERLEYMLLPKLLGLAERAWAPDPVWATEADAGKSETAYNEAWSEFVNILGKRELPRLNHYAGGFNYRIPTAGAKVENGKVVANVQLPGMEVRYTTDGADPTLSSKLYTGPISEKGTVKLRIIDSTGRAGRVTTVENK
ncbi:beta-N-acetylhexosaminidase [Pontibacter diazotrophicus]|uniref:beta-N-acetylhexosaminidase n=1 Tax=Pontibacter diazotrophicus TaxID=1400979 RepID=A0A3D8LG63_9BACT|nr:family 20 glycosylhydrolase [Pontibacter diazotrophicus]RDV16326.1 beta-N-acetylhexosaminidase [Pontibacter diazotrophicus]